MAFEQLLEPACISTCRHDDAAVGSANGGGGACMCGEEGRMRVCVCTCTSTCIFRSGWIQTKAHKHTNTRTHEHTNTRTHEHTNTRRHEHTQTRTHARTHAHMHTCTCTQIMQQTAPVDCSNPSDRFAVAFGNLVEHIPYIFPGLISHTIEESVLQAVGSILRKPFNDLDHVPGFDCFVCRH